LVAFVGAALCGCLTQALLWRASLGLGWFLVNVILVGTTLFTLRPDRRPAAAIVGLANLVLGFAVVYYASEWARWIAFPANLTLLFLLPFVATAREVRFVPRSIVEGIVRAPHAACATAQWPARAFDAKTRDRTRSLLRGTLIGLPLAVLFALLLSADPGFAGMLWSGLDRSGDVGQFALFSVLTSVGYLLLYVIHLPDEPSPDGAESRPYRALHAGPEPKSSASRFTLPRVRPLTWGVVLAQVALVFALFAVVHARELFAGHEFARAAGTVTYAEYLHAGFTRLLCATVLAVATVVLGHILLRPRAVSGGAARDDSLADEPIPGGRAIAGLEGVLLGLVGVALASCWQRSSIYEIAYGYTYLRLAVRFIELGVLGLVALTLVKSVARSWRGYEVGVAALGLVVLLAAACFNADLYVARGNVARAADVETGSGSPYAWKTLDQDYLAGLSRDALPVLQEPYFVAAPNLANGLRESWTSKTPRGWRSFRGLSGRF
jgi:hypothetical protein